MEIAKLLLRGSTSQEVEPLSKNLRATILATLAYYDVFDFPLKAREIFECLVNFKNLDDRVQGTGYRVQNKVQFHEALDAGRWTLDATLRELDQLTLEQLVDCRDGYYFLFNREYLVPLRLKREKIVNRKWLIAKRAVWWLRFIPYVRAVFASGSLAMRNTDELSDLDVLIVVKHGHIWLSRFLILGILTLLVRRRRGTDSIAPDKICPNHFITDKSLNIPFKSVYTAQTYANLVPIYVRDADLIEKFKKANDWVLDYVSGWNIEKVVGEKKEVEPLLRGSTSNLAKIIELVLDYSGIANILENWLRRYQSRRIARNPATHQTGGRVIFTDEQLEFHPHSIEASVLKKYNKNLEKLNMPNLAVEQDSGLIR